MSRAGVRALVATATRAWFKQFHVPLLLLGSENVGGAAVTGVVEGVRRLQPAKFWVHSNRQIQAQKMHSNFCWLSLANLFFF